IFCRRCLYPYGLHAAFILKPDGASLCCRAPSETETGGRASIVDGPESGSNAKSCHLSSAGSQPKESASSQLHLGREPSNARRKRPHPRRLEVKFPRGPSPQGKKSPPE